MAHNGKSLTSLTTLSDGMQPKSLPTPKSLPLKKALLPPPDRLAIGYGSTVQSITRLVEHLYFCAFREALRVWSNYFPTLGTTL